MPCAGLAMDEPSRGKNASAGSIQECGLTLRSSAMHNRCLISILVILTIATGLASRRFSIFPDALGKYPGDALWAQMVYWLVALCAPAASSIKVALVSLAISYADELSQLYQAPWVNQIRATTLGHLVLGSHFSWLDMLSYTIGIVLIAPLDWWVVGRATRHEQHASS